MYVTCIYIYRMHIKFHGFHGMHLIHKTILGAHVDSTTKIISTKFNTLTNKSFCQTMKILPTKFNTRTVICMYVAMYNCNYTYSETATVTHKSMRKF